MQTGEQGGWRRQRGRSVGRLCESHGGGLGEALGGRGMENDPKRRKRHSNRQGLVLEGFHSVHPEMPKPHLQSLHPSITYYVW